jgi:hypothetical protein
MMRLNALDSDDGLLHAVADAGRGTSEVEVIALLRETWRERVMGAWFALFHDNDAVRCAVLDSLASSAGSLTSEPLVAVAVALAGTSAGDALQRYAGRDLANGWGASGVAAAAMEHLGVYPAISSATNDDRTNFTALLKIAERLRKKARDRESEGA